MATDQKNIKTIDQGEIINFIGLNSLDQLIQQPTSDFATANQGTKADNAVPQTREITVGPGLDGGGTLDDDIEINLDPESITNLAKANTSVQPDSLANVAFSGEYGDLDNLPTLGSAAETDSSDYATASQGELADQAVLFTEQELTDSEQTQSRTNISAAKVDVTEIVGSDPSLDLILSDTGAIQNHWFSRESIATYTNVLGDIVTSNENDARYSYNSNTGTAGLLIEESRTNLLLDSEQLMFQSVAVTANTYSLSFYGPGSITLSGAATGTLVGSSNRANMQLSPSAGTLNLTPSGLVYNAQLEIGAAPSSYISTTDNTETRAEDICIIPDISWFKYDQGTFVVTAITPAAGNNRYVFILHDDTQNNRINIMYNNGNIYVVVVNNGNTTVSHNMGAVANNTKFCAAITFDGSEISSSLNGETIATNITSIPNVSQLDIGKRWDDGGFLNSTIERITFFPVHTKDILHILSRAN